MKVLLISPRLAALQELAQGLSALEDVALDTAAGGREALELLKPGAYDLAVLDEELSDPPLREMLTAVLGADAFINMAVITGLGEEEFHEVYEGFGLLAGLKPGGDEGQLNKLLSDLRSVRAGLAGASV
jgi:DNA-binding response OmpR family regulator